MATARAPWEIPHCPWQDLIVSSNRLYRTAYINRSVQQAIGPTVQLKRQSLTLKLVKGEVTAGFNGRRSL